MVKKTNSMSSFTSIQVIFQHFLNTHFYCSFHLFKLVAFVSALSHPCVGQCCVAVLRVELQSDESDLCRDRGHHGLHSLILRDAYVLKPPWQESHPVWGTKRYKCDFIIPISWDLRFFKLQLWWWTLGLSCHNWRPQHWPTDDPPTHLNSKQSAYAISVFIKLFLSLGWHGTNKIITK